MLLGTIWSSAVDRFYKGVRESVNTATSLNEWYDGTEGWVGDKLRDKYTPALESWLATYYQQFDPKDGVRNGSEKFVENERFLGYLDGLSADHRIIHECKSTSRAKSVSEQLWKVQHSIQVKLYTVLTGAEGVCIEFAYKDTPFAIWRAPVLDITKEQRDTWERELNALADFITSLGDNPDNYPCNPDGCCYVGKNSVSMCQYASLCDKIEGAEIAFKAKTNRRK